MLDDHDFYERQDIFTLAQQRGIATALNALVFRTYCPASSGEILMLTVVGVCQLCRIIVHHDSAKDSQTPELNANGETHGRCIC